VTGDQVGLGAQGGRCARAIPGILLYLLPLIFNNFP
jgi:hypothetical protein